jgi:predicted HTH transcriptional regulator
MLTISGLPNNHKSYTRNSLIAGAFHICGLIDKKGEGISRMIDACKDEGFPLPKFYEDAWGLSVALKFKNSMGPINSPPRNPLRFPNNQWG